MTTGPAPICVKCKWWNKEGLGFTCRAFPGGIPREIILTLHDHRFSFPGDHGIRYEPADPKNEVPTLIRERGSPGRRRPSKRQPLVD